MKLVYCLIAGALAVSQAEAATYVLDFEGDGVIEDTFGDNAQADLAYRAIDANAYGDVATTGDLLFWGTGYGDLNGAAWGGPNPSHAEIRIEATNASEFVTLNSFEMGGWAADEDAQWRVFDLAWNLIGSGSGVAPNVNGHLDVMANVSAQGGLILQWGEDAWDVGVQNVSYSVGDLVAPVPLPAGGLLLVGGLGLLALRKRRG